MKGHAVVHPLVTQTEIDAYQRDGVVLIKGLFAEHVDKLRAGIERNWLNLANMLPRT